MKAWTQEELQKDSMALSSREMFTKTYDLEKKHIDRWNQLVIGRKTVRDTTI
jgi:hypothetical protein